MQTFISKYGLAAHLAILAVTPLFLFPFCGESEIAGVMVWLSALACLWLVMEPSRRSGEMLHESRTRVFGAVLRDPLFWVFALLAVFALFRAINGDVACVWDAAIGKNVLKGQACSVWPCHAAGTGQLQFATVLAALVAVSAARSALGKSARIFFATATELLAAVSAMVTSIACLAGSGDAALMTSFSAVQPGNAYGLYFLASIVAAAGMLECRWNGALLIFSLSIGATGTGLFLFSTPLALMVDLALGLILFIGSAAYLSFSKKGADVFKYVVTVALAAAVPIIALTFFADPETVRSHAAAFGGFASFPQNLFPEGFLERRAELSSASFGVWRQHLWIGSGLGAFPEAMVAAGKAVVGEAPAAPFNGWWQILAERGILGLVAILLPVGFMTFTLVRRIAGAIGRKAFIPLAALGAAVMAAVAIESAFGCNLSRPETLLAAGTFYALSASSFPERAKTPADGEGKDPQA